MDAETRTVEGLTRRRLLTFAGASITAGSIGAIAPALPSDAHGTIRIYPGIDGQRTVYEPTGRLTSFGYRPSFHRRLDEWLEFWTSRTPDHWGRPMRVWSFGAHTDHRHSVAHNAGRGFDLTRLYTTSPSGRVIRRFNARYDIWRNWSPENRNRARMLYWATSASLNFFFENVLTYLYNRAHHNHIHIDNLVSGQRLSVFHPGNGPAQVLHVQACCRYIWGKPTTIDGIWGPQTRRHSTDIIRRLGKESGTILSSPQNWRRFNGGTCIRGTRLYP